MDLSWRCKLIYFYVDIVNANEIFFLILQRNEFEHNTGKCLTSHENSDKVTLEECEDYDDQKWFFRERIFKDWNKSAINIALNNLSYTVKFEVIK